MYKRILAILVVFSIFCLNGAALALAVTGGEGFTEVIFENENISEEKKTAIINMLLDNLSPESPVTASASGGNWLCIFGHDIDEQGVNIINHYYFDTDPKCLARMYHVTFCLRENCSYMTEELLGESRTMCH